MAPSANLPEMPPLRSRSSLRYGTRRWFAEVTCLAAARQDRVNVALGERATPGSAVLNWKIGFHGRKLRLAAGMDNALSRLYYDASSYLRDPFRSGIRVPEPGRMLSTNFTYEF